MDTTFADAILNVSVTGNLIRIDLGTVSAVPAADGKQELRASRTQQLVMPLEGFVRGVALQERVVKKLIEDGVLKMQPDDAAGGNAGAGPASPALAPAPAGRAATVQTGSKG